MINPCIVHYKSMTSWQLSNLNETALGSVPRGCIIAFDMI